MPGGTIERRRMSPTEIETEIMRQIAGHPDCAGVTPVHILPTTEEPPRFTWRLSAIVRDDEAATGMQRIDDVVRTLQAEVDVTG